jgi:hypothetical protein
VGHTLIVIIYHMRRNMRRNRTPYQDLGADYFERLATSRLQRQYVRRLQSNGFAVSLSPVSVV